MIYYLHLIMLPTLLFFSIGCAEEKTVALTKPIQSYTRTFNDLNNLHKEAAEEIGIAPISSREEAKKRGRELKEIESNQYYQIAPLTHSLPFLIPSADKLLFSIGKEFQRQLKNKKLSPYKIRVTSVLRTQEDIKKLNRRNVNSSSNSAHTHATTFDISYTKFEKIGKNKPDVPDHILKRTLAEVLQYHREQEMCYIKYEVRQGCFHITTR